MCDGAEIRLPTQEHTRSGIICGFGEVASSRPWFWWLRNNTVLLLMERMLISTNQPTRVLDAAELTSCNDDAVDVGLQWVHHIGSSCFMDH
jgi:hypothetical protein